MIKIKQEYRLVVFQVLWTLQVPFQVRFKMDIIFKEGSNDFPKNVHMGVK